MQQAALPATPKPSAKAGSGVERVHVAIRPNRCWAANVIIGGIGIMMMEPTLTQNSALYFVQHKVSRPHASLFQRFGAAARKRSPNVSQAQLRGNLFRWPRIHWGKNS